MFGAPLRVVERLCRCYSPVRGGAVGHGGAEAYATGLSEPRGAELRTSRFGLVRGYPHRADHADSRSPQRRGLVTARLGCCMGRAGDSVFLVVLRRRLPSLHEPCGHRHLRLAIQGRSQQRDPQSL
ncbi:hypothetical protein SDC9_139667 [bioreactor metagenome]|uniref:Uncharacterized protein n=1 Tax=bioreactor metagenome TaxID=1076179 RepID=A0A645DW14_9ZZZZ